jgi:ribose-phosphate pyrophosphokinase
MTALQALEAVGPSLSLASASASVFGENSGQWAATKSVQKTVVRLSLNSVMQPRCTVANSLANSSVSCNGRPVIPALQQETWNGTAASRTLADMGMREMGSNSSRLKIFSGTANPQLSQEIACYMGLNLSAIKIKRFADGEIYVQLQESIRGCDVFLVQPTCPPANENLMELLIMIDACRRASAKTITAVIPYFGYARADRKVSSLIDIC